MGKLYRIDERKRITLPESILKELEAGSGDYINFEIRNGKVVLRKMNVS